MEETNNEKNIHGEDAADGIGFEGIEQLARSAAAGDAGDRGVGALLLRLDRGGGREGVRRRLGGPFSTQGKRGIPARRFGRIRPT